MSNNFLVNGLEITRPAPVVISTLCRFKHLKSLLESLSECKGAQFTDVFIAVDYPLKDSHWDGYRKICDYLDKAGNMGFKSLNVVKRDRNYGFGKEGNGRTMVQEVLKTYDRYIFSEDDNVFAPQFLNYINYCLEYFKNDKSIYGICGYLYPIEVKAENDLLKLTQFSAWGWATWKDRRNESYCFYDDHKKQYELSEDSKTKHFFKKLRPNIYTDVLDMANGGPILGDSLTSAYLVYKDMKAVFPSKSLVRNTGWDGSGTHGGVMSHISNQSINESTEPLHYILASDADNETIDKEVYRYHKSNIARIQHILTWMTIKLYTITGIYYNFKGFRKVWKKIRQLRNRQ